MNTQKSGGNDWNSAKFVKRVEMAVMQYVILGKASESQGGVTKENLQQVFRGNMQMSGDHFEHCLNQLVGDGHLKQEGNKYVPTDDGREDVQKLHTLVLELPNVVQGGSQKQGMTAQKTTGGQGGGNVGGSNESIVGGNTGNVQNKGGNVGGANQGGPQQSKGGSNQGLSGGASGNMGASMSGGATQNNRGKQGGFDGATGGEMSQGVGSGGKSGISGNVGTGGSQGSGNTGQTIGNQGNFGRNNSGSADTGAEWKQGTVNKGGATQPSVPDKVGDKTGSNLKAKNDRI